MQNLMYCTLLKILIRQDKIKRVCLIKTYFKLKKKHWFLFYNQCLLFICNDNVVIYLGKKNRGNV